MTDEPTRPDPEAVAVTATPAAPGDDGAPAAGSPVGPRDGSSRRREARWVRIGAVLALGLVVAAGAFGVARWLEARDLRAERSDRREVAGVAAAFGEAYLTYDFSDVEASSAAVRALATDAFAAGFEETSAPGIQELFASNQTTTVATVEEVFVGDVDDGRARALVVVDVSAASSASGTQRLSDLSFVLDLVRDDGRWLVSAVAPAPRPDISDPAGGPTTTTSPPTTPGETPPGSAP